MSEGIFFTALIFSLLILQLLTNIKNERERFN
jgi:hypothetical protein